MNKQIKALRKRQNAAWEMLYREHTRDIYGFVYRTLGRDPQASEDVFQAVWMEAMNRIEQFDPDRGELRQWIFGIARRQVALSWRKQQTRPGGRPWAPLGAHDDAGLLPDEMMERMEQAEIVRASLLVLSPRRRQVLTEKYVDGLSVRQIAAKTGDSVKAVESLLSRARSELRSLLGCLFTLESEANRRDD